MQDITHLNARIHSISERRVYCLSCSVAFFQAATAHSRSCSGCHSMETNRLIILRYVINIIRLIIIIFAVHLLGDVNIIDFFFLQI